MRLEGKVAIVTGGGGGIGRATAQLFAAEGARVVIAELQEESGRGTLEAVTGAGGKAIFVPTDISSEEQIQALIDTAIRTYGKIDVLHNNVGGSTTNDGPITTVSNDEFWLKMRVDVFGTWLGCRYAIPQMIENGGGSIINMTSVNAIIGVKGRNAYATAKGAITSLTRALAVQYADQAIRVNCIAPGRTLTERILSRQGNRKATDLKDDSHLLGLIEPVDVAQTVLHLASDESRRTTGQMLVVDSGLTIH
jgi:NAD(P)-dependent dehydrogenase (short-subunit alcohol dehydrogenase family)